MGRFLTGLAAFLAGVLLWLALNIRAPGGRGALAAPVVLLGLATGLAYLTRLRRHAWLLAAAAVPVQAYLVLHPFRFTPRHHPGLILVEVMIPTGVILAGPLLAMRHPGYRDRLAAMMGFVAGLATGPLLLDAYGYVFEHATAVAFYVAAGAVLLAAFFALRCEHSTVDLTPRRGPWWGVAAVGTVLGVVQYVLLQKNILAGGDDYPYRTGHRAMLIWAWSYGLGIAVTVALAVLAYRQAGEVGARWVMAAAALSYPLVIVYGPFYSYQPAPVWARAAAGLAGAGVGVLLTAGGTTATGWSRVDSRIPCEAVGLGGLAVLAYQTTADRPAAPVWLLGLGLTGLVLGAALSRLIRRPGIALTAAGTGLAAWVFAVRALSPVVDVDVPRPAMVAWPLACAAVVVPLHLSRRRTASLDVIAVDSRQPAR